MQEKLLVYWEVRILICSSLSISEVSSGLISRSAILKLEFWKEEEHRQLLTEVVLEGFDSFIVFLVFDEIDGQTSSSKTPSSSNTVNVRLVVWRPVCLHGQVKINHHVYWQNINTWKSNKENPTKLARYFLWVSFWWNVKTSGVPRAETFVVINKRSRPSRNRLMASERASMGISPANIPIWWPSILSVSYIRCAISLLCNTCYVYSIILWYV